MKSWYRISCIQKLQTKKFFYCAMCCGPIPPAVELVEDCRQKARGKLLAGIQMYLLWGALCVSKSTGKSVPENNHKYLCIY